MKKIQAVCGFGIGSSLMLKITLDGIIKELGLEIETSCADIGTCNSNPCDAIFIGRELMDAVADNARVPLIPIDNFMDKEELKTKLLDFVKGE